MKTVIISILAVSLLGISNMKNQEVNEIFPGYKQGLIQSKIEDKPLLLLFTANSCTNNLATKKIITSSKEIQKLLSDKFIFIEFKLDDNSELDISEQYQSEVIKRKITTVGERNIDLEISKFQKGIQPYFVLLDYNENIIDDSAFISTEKDLIEFLKNGLVF